MVSFPLALETHPPGGRGIVADGERVITSLNAENQLES